MPLKKLSRTLLQEALEATAWNKESLEATAWNKNCQGAVTKPCEALLQKRSKTLLWRIFVQTDSRLSKLPDFVHVTGVWIQNLDLRGRPSEACSLLNAKKHASSAPAPPTRNVLGLFYRKRTLDSRAFPYKGSFLYKKMKSCKLANTRTVPVNFPKSNSRDSSRPLVLGPPMPRQKPEAWPE